MICPLVLRTHVRVRLEQLEKWQVDNLLKAKLDCEYSSIKICAVPHHIMYSNYNCFLGVISSILVVNLQCKDKENKVFEETPLRIIMSQTSKKYVQHGIVDSRHTYNTYNTDIA